jgi:hypothetical protein
LIAPDYKKLIRTALRDDVPARTLNRPDKGGWGARLREEDTSWDANLPSALQAVLRPDWFPTPARRLAMSEAFGLTQLVVFLDRFKARQLQRGKRAVLQLAHLPALAPP